AAFLLWDPDAHGWRRPPVRGVRGEPTEGRPAASPGRPVNVSVTAAGRSTARETCPRQRAGRKESGTGDPGVELEPVVAPRSVAAAAAGDRGDPGRGQAGRVRPPGGVGRPAGEPGRRPGRAAGHALVL